MTESDFAPLAAGEWDESLAHIVEDMHGRPINVHGLMANHPPLLEAWWDIRNYTVAGGDLGKRNAELVILRVAWHMRCWYEWASHVHRGQAAGLSMQEIDRVGDGPDAAGWLPHECALLRAVDDLVACRRIASSTLAALRLHFSDQQVMDLVVTQGAYVILACLLNTWDIPLDAEVAAALPGDVTRAAFESRLPNSGQ